ncbi:MAG: hypothetical protein HY814_12690, partial [Candidatus Riflebacteria bacterium]|nr:hypothetical protein [Candidatus Riflebacteria bacterium]
MPTEQFSELMSRRVKEILLVASEFDVFNLEECGHLTEAIVHEFESLELSVGEAPRFTPVSTAARALQLLAERRFDLVLAIAHTPEFPVRSLAAEVKGAHPDLPIGVLVDHAWLLPQIYELRRSGVVDWVFLWQGDIDPLLALVRQVEDRMNVDADVTRGGVQMILFVEDELRFFSFFLPRLYSEVTRQTNRLMADGINLTHRLLRMRARPKILLCQTYEEAMDLHRRFAGNILGVISDLGFPRAGTLDPLAGCALARELRSACPDVPIVLQSTEESNRGEAEQAQAAFVCKASPTLLDDLRKHLLESFGFGDFVFRLPVRTEVGRAGSLRQLLPCLEAIPDDSLTYHVGGNHFSRWLRARTEFQLATLLRPARAQDFRTTAELRAFLIQSLRAYLHQIQQHVTADFRSDRFDSDVALARMGPGSLGGKGRGLAFMHKLLAQAPLEEPGLEAVIPQAVVLATGVFEEFLQDNRLATMASDSMTMSDQEVLDAFRRGRLGRRCTQELVRLLSSIDEPIAVRSSSLLEDSLYQPFSGIYATVMLPNNHPSLDVRLAQLLEAIKVVYASTYMRAARDYVKLTPHRLDEELMAVIIQRIVGRSRGCHFYPMVSGVASSYNFYRFGEIRP